MDRVLVGDLGGENFTGFGLVGLLVFGRQRFQNANMPTQEVDQILESLFSLRGHVLLPAAQRFVVQTRAQQMNKKKIPVLGVLHNLIQNSNGFVESFHQFA
uniref:(northern house mosquito) hypothetical protein n=1 Tax=Culex pipiens TaxID=7175 RepID=A0A8D8F3C4_CULPI